MKKGLYILMLVMVLILSACSNSTNEDMNEDDNVVDVVDDQTGDQTDDQTDDQTADLLQLTIEELAMYDGQNGNPAYIAVNGVVYDVTGVDAWSGGTHQGNMAGTDLTDVIDSAPHGTSVLDGLEIVGEITN